MFWLYSLLFSQCEDSINEYQQYLLLNPVRTVLCNFFCTRTWVWKLTKCFATVCHFVTTLILYNLFINVKYNKKQIAFTFVCIILYNPFYKGLLIKFKQVKLLLLYYYAGIVFGLHIVLQLTMEANYIHIRFNDEHWQEEECCSLQFFLLLTFCIYTRCW